MTTPTPVEISDLSMAFPADALDYMPKWEDIPAEFREGSSPWCDLANMWFGRGLSSYFGFLPATINDEKIEGEKIMRHIGAILRSYAPKHEHKIATVAYLSSLWMEGVVFGQPDCDPKDLKAIGDFVEVDEWVKWVDDGKPTEG